MPTTSRAPLSALLISRALGSAGYYLVSPFLAVWLLEHATIPGELIATIVGLHVLAMRAGAVLLQPVIGRFSRDRVALVSYMVAAASLFVVSAIDQAGPAWWMGVVLVNGLALSVANVTTKAIVAGAFDQHERLAAFGKLNAVVNGGAAVGPLIGGVLIGMRGGWFLLAPAAVLLLAAAAAAMLPRVAPDRPTRADRSGPRLPSRTLLAYMGLTALVWMGYAQFLNVLPVFAHGHVPGTVISTLFAINAVLIVVLQAPVARLSSRLSRRFGPDAVLAAGYLVLAPGVGVLLLGRTDAWVMLFVGAVVFTLSELLWAPAVDAGVATHAGSTDPLLAYGIAGLGWGFAESLGGALGVALVTSGGSGMLPAGASFLIAAGLALGLAAWVWLRQRRAEPAPVAEEKRELAESVA